MTPWTPSKKAQTSEGLFLWADWWFRSTVTGSLTNKLDVYSSQIPPLTLTETLQLQLTLGQSTALAFHVLPATHSCGLHIIWVTQSLISGNNPFEIDELTKDILQELRETITCRLAQEWIASKASLSPSTDTTPILSKPSTKSIATAPFQTPFNPILPVFIPVPITTTLHDDSENLTGSFRIEQSPVFYIPLVGSWALWDISSQNIYSPAQIIQVSDLECIVEIPGGIVLPDGQQKLQSEQHVLSIAKTRSIFENPVENIPAKQLVRLLWPAINDDSELKQELVDKEDNLDEVTCLSERQRLLLRYLRRKMRLVWLIILGLEPSLVQLQHEWAEYMAGVRHGLAFLRASSTFAEKHMAILNAQDKIFILMIGTVELGWKMKTNGHDNDSSQGLGCALLTYYALAFYLNITPGEAYQAVREKRLYRPQSNQDFLWQLIYEASNSIIQLEKFIRSHRIPSSAVNFPNLVYLPRAPPPPPPSPPSYPLVNTSGVELQTHSSNPKQFDLKEQMGSSNAIKNGGTHFDPTQERDSVAPSLDSTPSGGSLAHSPAPGINSNISNTQSAIPELPEESNQGKKRNRRTYSPDGCPPSYQLRSRKFKG
ncbi:hypothetical protein M422DRAFT_262348 [Sphaerobolus stellatus SS14]|uniref:Unplaced genomic scaffold SPHSTscaffold_114, whole genome shotgun sequence n=1 Tax=Sphaerobolus stellatus (strain SS14) TaxID=990650 RepID=A0A0C9V198_SPHS4|nr:hypothetical protein M422DRAFT_262348 [Sphaerobolus stellatus SS14]